MAQFSRAVAENSSDPIAMWNLLSHFLPPNVSLTTENPAVDAMDVEMQDMSFTLFLPLWEQAPLDVACMRVADDGGTYTLAQHTHTSNTALVRDPVEATHFFLDSMLPGTWCPDQLAAMDEPIPNMLSQLDLANLGLATGIIGNNTLGVTRASLVQQRRSTSNDPELVLHPIEMRVSACKVLVYWYLSSTGMRYGVSVA